MHFSSAWYVLTTCPFVSFLILFDIRSPSYSFVSTHHKSRHFTNPRKVHVKNNQLPVPVLGHALRRQKLPDELNVLASSSQPNQPSSSTIIAASPSPILQEEELLEALQMELDAFPVLFDGEDASHSAITQHIRIIHRTARSTSGCAGWKACGSNGSPTFALGFRLSSCISSRQAQKLSGENDRK